MLIPQSLNRLRVVHYLAKNFLFFSSSSVALETSTSRQTDDSVPSNSRKKFLITVPIFYVNSDPHIGHLYTVLLADAIFRWKHVKAGNATIQEQQNFTDSIFVVGTDEHGRKIELASLASGRTPIEHCKIYSEKFRELFDHFGIKYNRFSQTSLERHQRAVQHFWNVLDEKGWIFKDRYEGWYSTIDECFYSTTEIEERDSVLGAYLTDSDPIRVAKETQSPVQWISEENFMFRLSAFTERIHDWLLSSKEIIIPPRFQTLVLNDLSAHSLADLSISRPTARCSWGIPVPGDPSQMIYVWLDALVSYLSAVGYPFSAPESFCWPPDIQVLGKDILKFHAIYWPAFLMAAELPLPKILLVHSHWLVDHIKMSKSRGNVICPFDACSKLGANEYGVEALRYFLLRHGMLTEDGNITLKKVVEVVNTELVNDLGNLIQRSTALRLNPTQKYPRGCSVKALADVDSTIECFLERLRTFSDRMEEFFSRNEFNLGLTYLAETVRHANHHFHLFQPWKRPAASVEVRSILLLSYETARLCAFHLLPVTPRYAERIFKRLGIPSQQRQLSSTTRCFDENGTIANGRIILQRKSESKLHIGSASADAADEPDLGSQEHGPLWPRIIDQI